MNTVSKTWNPSKTGSQYTQEEILDTPVYHDLLLINPELQSDVDVLVAMARDFITAKFNASQSLTAVVASFFAALEAHGIVGDQVLLDRETLAAKVLRNKTTRWKARHYAELIGEVFYRELQARNDRKGTYTLYIEEPWPNSEIPFRARLVDPDGFETRYPPRQKTARKTKTYLEVTSMSALTKECKAKAGMSPSVFFGLGPAEPDQVSPPTPKAKPRSVAASPVSSKPRCQKHRIKYKTTPSPVPRPSSKPPAVALKVMPKPLPKPKVAPKQPKQGSVVKPPSFFY
jgi:hypothetical protein